VTVTECDRLPLVPVTLTKYVPGVDEVTESIEVPEPVTLVGFKVAVSPDGLVADKVTTLANELTEFTVIDDVPVLPAVIVTVVGLAVIVKSGAPVTTTGTMIECARTPLAPVILMKKDPTTEPETVSVEVPELRMNTGLSVAVRLESEGIAARLTFPLKPLRSATLIVDVAEPPTMNVRLAGLAVIVKSGAPVTVILPEVPELPL
jgi:hypothetical protein